MGPGFLMSICLMTFNSSYSIIKIIPILYNIKHPTRSQVFTVQCSLQCSATIISEDKVCSESHQITSNPIKSKSHQIPSNPIKSHQTPSNPIKSLIVCSLVGLTAGGCINSLVLCLSLSRRPSKFNETKQLIRRFEFIMSLPRHDGQRVYQR